MANLCSQPSPGRDSTWRACHSPGWVSIGGAFQGGSDNTASALAAEGYYVVSVNHDLAPCNVIPGQHCHDSTDAGKASGRPPQQSEDIKAFVRALRADTAHCNGKIGVVGGSAGGTHAVWVALATTVSVGWPKWNQSGDDRVDCAVSLSGAYDLSDRTVEHYGSDDDSLPHFIGDVENYTYTGDLTIQKNVSPVSLVKPASQAVFRPLYLFNSIHDSMPYHQIVDMICALKIARSA